MKTIQDYLSKHNVDKDRLYKMALSIVSCSLDANGWNAYEDGKEFITIKGSNLEFIKAILSDLVNNKEDEKIPQKIQKGLVNTGCWDYGKFDFSKLREI